MRQKIAFWTRQFKNAETAGRPRLVNNMSQGPLIKYEHNVVENLAESKRWLEIFMRLLKRIFCCDLLPLQCLIFDCSRAAKKMDFEYGEVKTVLIDGVRLLELARQIRPKAQRLVCDMHDLMSARYEFESKSNSEMSFGYLDKFLPKSFKKIGKMLKKVILRYEVRALVSAENEMVELCDSVVLLSSVEAESLQRRLPERLRSRIIVISPPQPVFRCFIKPIIEKLRFVFIGAENLKQNRESIIEINRLIEESGGVTKVNWFGRRNHQSTVDLSHVISHGFVGDLIQEVYTAGSILVYPCKVPGGIKTKVLEAIGYGCPVIADELAFEGLGWEKYPLVIRNVSQWCNIFCGDYPETKVLEEAVAFGQEMLLKNHGDDEFNLKWDMCLQPNNSL